MLRTGDIVYVSYPYEYDSTQTKARPALVVIPENHKGDFSVIKLTTTERKSDPCAVEIKDLAQAGLFRPTYARCDKMCELNKSALIHNIGIRGKLGRASSEDIENINLKIEQQKNKLHAVNYYLGRSWQFSDGVYRTDVFEKTQVVGNYEHLAELPEDKRITEWFGEAGVYELKSTVTEKQFNSSYLDSINYQTRAHNIKERENMTGLKRTLFIDTEITGLNKYGDDEILSIAILDDNGNTLMDTLVKPVNHKSWPDAQRVHGISPEAVADAPTFEQLKPTIIDLFSNATDIVIYNAAYDWQCFKRDIEPEHLQHIKTHCAMLEFAEIYGEVNEKHGTFKWQKLSTAMCYYGLQWQGSAHSAIADTLALRDVWHAMHPDTPAPKIAHAPKGRR